MTDKFIAFFDLPVLQGAESEIAVAENIRIRILLDLVEEIFQRYPAAGGSSEERYLGVLALIQERSIPESTIFWDLLRQDWALWWIENRFSTIDQFLLS
ncbi:MAG: hypothetical protein GX295_10125 [Syntrophomonadaceae bacterium]|nr:hypothetical protein [Syntrophomonadaceae bacterium]